MPDLWMDVDAALSEVPVNIMPLLDDTDFKSRETGVTFDQAGMDLVWNFVTTGGAFAQTAVTPTSGGNYDWTNQGDGMYTIEIPASGGVSINNDTEGFGWFTGFATGILPWRGPTIGFRAAALNNSLIDGTTIDVNVTAMAASVVTAAAVATGAIDADAIAADAATELRSLVSGTSDAGGSNSTMVDAARTEANDVWNGAWILFTSGTVANQMRIISDFDAATDTITFTPVTTASIGAGITYEIIPNAGADLRLWKGTTPSNVSGSGAIAADVEEWRTDTPNVLIGGRVDSDIGAMQSNVVTASALNADAVSEIGDEVNAEVLDVLNVDTFAEPGQEAPPATTTLVKKIGYLYKAFRNRITQTSTTLSLYADNASTVDQKSTVSDDATTYDRGELVGGP
ncbi:MAG TPA: hypothetical protein VI729_02560 [Anaerolineales bacterium]|nr:hypothetical protein [Anaerolineales bacterium]